MLNVRLDEKLDEQLNSYSTETDSSKTMIVKEALAMYFSKHEAALHAYELGDDLFGTAGSGNADASTTYKARLKQKLNEKHTH